MMNHYPIEFFKNKKLSRILFLFISLIAFTIISCSKDDATDPSKPAAPSTGTVAGTLREGSNDLVGATVVLKQAGKEDKSVTVAADGSFKFTDVPAGNISLAISLPSYVSQTVQAYVIAGQEIIVPIVMSGDLTKKTFIPDAKFEEILISYGYDTGAVDGSVPTFKISRVKFLNLSDKGVADLTGIQDFAALEDFSCSNIYGTSVIKLTTIDVSKNTALKGLDISFNNLTTLDVSKNTALETLILSGNPLSNLDVTNLTSLTLLYADRNPLTTLDVTKNTSLKNLSFSGNITSIDVSKNTALTGLYGYNGKLTSLDVSKNTALQTIWVSNNQLTSVNVSNNSALKVLYCYENALTTLDVSSNKALVELSCSNNKLQTLDLSKNVDLVTLSCGKNLLMNLDVRSNLKLVSLSCSNNLLTSLDLSKNPLIGTEAGRYFFCGNNLLSKLNLKNGNNINFIGGNFLGNTSTLQIAVDDVDFANAKWKNYKDAAATFVSSFSN